MAAKLTIFGEQGEWTPIADEIVREFADALRPVMEAHPEVSPRELAYIANSAVMGEHLRILAKKKSKKKSR